MKKSAYIKYLISLLLFGSNGIIASHISLSSGGIVFFRTLIGGALLTALLYAGGGRLRLKGQAREAGFVAASGVCMGASWLLLFQAYKLLGVSIASLLYYCGPVMVMALSPLLFKERLTAAKVLGFGAVLAGVVLINGGVGSGALDRQGVLCGALSAVAYAAMVILNKRSGALSGLENTSIQLIAAFATVTAYLGARQELAMAVPAGDWPWLLALCVVNTALACYLYFSSIPRLPVQTVAVCSYIDPLSALLLAALLLGERMTALQTLGAALIIAGAMAAELLGKKPRTTPQSCKEQQTEHTAQNVAGEREA